MVTSNTLPDVAPAAAPKRLPSNWICGSLGAAIYFASFFLPAAAASGEWIKGWECGRIALLAPFGEFHFLSLLLLGSGLINSLVLVYFSLRAFGRGGWIRGGVAIAAIALIPMSWIFLAVAHLAVGIGHVLWVGGLLLMLLPDVIRFVRRGWPW